MIIVGLYQNYLHVIDEDTGILVDNPKDYIIIRKKHLSDTTYTFYYKYAGGLQIAESNKLCNVPISQIKALNNEFTDFNATSFEEWYSSNVGFKTATGGSVAGITADNYTDLITTNPTATTGSLAYVYFDEGTKWLPFSLGGTYKPAGWYWYNGSEWTTYNYDISEEFNSIENEQTAQDNRLLQLETDISNKLDKFQTAYHLKNVNELLAIHPANINNEIELGKAIYYIDSLDFDLGIYKLVTNTDTAIHGYSQLLSQMTSNEDNISMITSTGNLFLFDIRFNCTGVNSQVLSMTGAGTESLDMKYVELSFGTTGGVINGIRQFFWFGGFGIGGRGFLLQGSMQGARISNTRVINFMDYVLKGDIGFTCNNIRSDANITIPLGSYAYDFDYQMFNVDGGYQLVNGIYDGGGDMVSPFTNGDTLIAENSMKSNFRDNAGVKGRNTYVQASWKLSNEVATSFAATNTLTKLNGVTISNNLVHFSALASNELTYNANIPKFFTLIGFIQLQGTGNDLIRLVIRKWDNLTSSYIQLNEYLKTINNIVGNQDKVEFNVIASNFEMNVGDRVEIWAENQTSTDSVTMKLSSEITIE